MIDGIVLSGINFSSTHFTKLLAKYIYMIVGDPSSTLNSLADGYDKHGMNQSKVLVCFLNTSMK